MELSGILTSSKGIGSSFEVNDHFLSNPKAFPDRKITLTVFKVFRGR